MTFATTLFESTEHVPSHLLTSLLLMFGFTLKGNLVKDTKIL